MAILLPLALICAGCGGTTSGPPPPRPPPVADFSLSLSSNPIPITQGAASPAVNVSVNAVNGFTGSVQAILRALTPGSQQITIINPDVETVSLDAPFTAN